MVQNHSQRDFSGPVFGIENFKNIIRGKKCKYFLRKRLVFVLLFYKGTKKFRMQFT